MGKADEVRLELGSGLRPTRGYTHADLHPFPHIEHVGDAWMLDLPDASVDEVFALAFIEHLTYEQALDTFRNVRRMLRPDGQFLFDVPDYPAWAAYYLHHLGVYVEGPDWLDRRPDIDHIRRTLFGWQRWPGDTHQYGWDTDHLGDALESCGFFVNSFDDVAPFKARAYRQRFDRPWDAHLYVVARPA